MNARTHGADQVKQLAASMVEWGFTVPVLVDESGGIIAGHGRVLAAQSLGWGEVPVMVAVGWTDAQKRAYVLADNKLALMSGWDEVVLEDELEALGAAGFDLDLAGFSVGDLSDLELDAEPTGFQKSQPNNIAETEKTEVEYQNLSKYPMTVIFDEAEAVEWDELKQKRGGSDKGLLLKLMRGEK